MKFSLKRASQIKNFVIFCSLNCIRLVKTVRGIHVQRKKLRGKINLTHSKRMDEISNKTFKCNGLPIDKYPKTLSSNVYITA